MTFIDTHYSEKTRSYYSDTREDMIEYVPKSVETVLDVGCADGAFGQSLIERGVPLVWGVEPSARAAEIASKRLHKVYNLEFSNELAFKGQTFDCIVFNDVLEHLVDPWQALINCIPLLSSSGIIVASIPNLQCYTVLRELIVSGDFKYRESGILDKTHLRFFTKKSIVRLFDEAGFSCRSINGLSSIERASRLLRILRYFLKSKAEPFSYTAYAVVAYLEKDK